MLVAQAGHLLGHTRHTATVATPCVTMARVDSPRLHARIVPPLLVRA